MWGLEKRDILADLETYLEEDAKLRAGQRTGRIVVEKAFGFGGDSVEVEDPESGLRFRGYIDRIDVSGDGSSALVIDYKTGSASPYRALEDDPIDGGKRLQLGVYSLAARALVPGTDVRAAYWFTTNRGGFRLAPQATFDLGDEEVRKRFEEVLTTIVSGIGAGMFPANPGPPGWGGPSNCSYCDFDSLCATRRADLWDRKKSDPGTGRLRGAFRPGVIGPAMAHLPDPAGERGKHFVPVDDGARRVIAEQLDETLFVEASAGTGKTASLVARLVSLVRTGRTTLDRIAAITFTETAAAELRDRVRQGLEEADADVLSW